MKKYITGIMLGLLCVPSLASADQKLGIVNIRELLENSTTAMAVSSTLQSEFTEPQSQLRDAEQKFMKKRAEFERESSTLSEADRQGHERELAALQRDLQVKQMEFNESFNQRQQEEMHKFMAQLKDVIDEYAQKESYDMVFPSDMSIYFSKPNDITASVMQKLDKTA